MSKSLTEKMSYPLLPLRDVVVFPHMVIPLFVGRPESINALNRAMDENKQIFLVAQKDAHVDNPGVKDLYHIGTIVTVLQLLRLPDGTVKVLVEGNFRAEILEVDKAEDYLIVDIKKMEEQINLNDKEAQANMRSVMTQFEQLVRANKKLPTELISSLSTIQDPFRLIDSIAAHMSIKLELRQQILEAGDLRARFELLQTFLVQELELIKVETRLQNKVKQRVEKSQRQYYLSEKMKAIQEEMGELDEITPIDEFRQLQDRIENAGMSPEAKEKAMQELSKLKMMPSMSAEATVSRNYLDWLLTVPWKKRSKVSKNIEKASEILEADHYGLKEVKERILEYLAVQQRVKKLKGPILCLVGPPGVGKTSLGQSIANATGRDFIRIALGGVRDEAEIRGHRRTYIGALPGKIIQKMGKVKVANPLFMLDEVDKMAMDFRGDPASALLEVLDPEQNHAFNDHYLEVDYDLSDVMFIATANSMNIPSPLLDRMEVIRLPGYTEDEKLNIATRYLVPRQLQQNGLEPNELSVDDDALIEIIRTYTREAGVRALERAISKICRKVVKEILTQKKKVKPHTVTVTQKNLQHYLGVNKYRYGIAEKEDRIGQVTGLAWTEVGGELLNIEAQIVPGKGKSMQTGSLGDVMQESIQTAMTVVRSRADALIITDKYFQNHDFHIHVPEGATPKDGPSAGIAMCTAIISAATRIPVRADVAMTGEITLRGDVLPIGGLKEKLLAALRGGIKEVIIPYDNKRELIEIPSNVTGNLRIHPVTTIDEVLALALQHVPGSKTNTKFLRKNKNSKTPPSSVRGHKLPTKIKKSK